MSQANIPVRTGTEKTAGIPCSDHPRGIPLVWYFILLVVWLGSLFSYGKNLHGEQVCDFSCKPFYYHWHPRCILGCFQLWQGFFIFSLFPKITRAWLDLAPRDGTHDFSFLDSGRLKPSKGHRDVKQRQRGGIWLHRSLLRGKQWDGQFWTHFVSS